MKLREWSEKTGIKYITAYRWFKAGQIEGAYQTGSGTILVPDDKVLENSMETNQSNDVMTMVLKKTVEFSKNSASVEDFAAWILSNFNLKFNSKYENPKYSKNKPKSEDVQNHYKEILKPFVEKPKPNASCADPKDFDITNNSLVQDFEDKVVSLDAHLQAPELYKAIISDEPKHQFVKYGGAEEVLEVKQKRGRKPSKITGNK